MDHPAPQKFLRLFCALELPPAVRARAAAHATRLRASCVAPAKASWEREEKMHVTLKFFGDVAPPRTVPLCRALAHCASSYVPFTLRLAGCGVFSSLSRPSVLWLGIEDEAGQLAALQRDLEDECARAGFQRDARSFHPHVTIARLRVVNSEARRLARLHAESDFEPASFRVGEIVLMQSTLGAQGSSYTAISKAKMGDGGSGSGLEEQR